MMRPQRQQPSKGTNTRRFVHHRSAQGKKLYLHRSQKRTVSQKLFAIPQSSANAKKHLQLTQTKMCLIRTGLKINLLSGNRVQAAGNKLNCSAESGETFV